MKRLILTLGAAALLFLGTAARLLGGDLPNARLMVGWSF